MFGQLSGMMTCPSLVVLAFILLEQITIRTCESFIFPLPHHQRVHRTYPRISLRLQGYELGIVDQTLPHSGTRPKRSSEGIDTSTSQALNWHVWKTADKLEEDALMSASLPPVFTKELVCNVVSILRQWGRQWAGQQEWQGILNKPSLLHEIEESIAALYFLKQFIESRTDVEGPITIVDVCCGKGIFSLLSSYFFQHEEKVEKIIMLDKADIKWHHVEISNRYAKSENRAEIEVWADCNLHDFDKVVQRLESIQTSVALVGIHLCKTLSPTCAGIVNAMERSHCPFFVLAPCCLPRVVVQSKYQKRQGAVIEVRQYESQEVRKIRHEAKERRKAAMVRGGRPKFMSDQIDIGNEGQQQSACWKCGEVGHVKADCPSSQSTGKPQLVKPPNAQIDVSNIFLSDSPFQTYCNLLATTIQRSDVEVVETGLINDKTKHQKNNWNNDRKSIYIVAK